MKDSNQQYDVIIVGAGPAGIFSALFLVRLGKKQNNPSKILIIEKGASIQERSKNRERGGKDILHGWGGAGAFSDGKLTLSVDVGGSLSKFIPIKLLEDDLQIVEDIYIEFGADRNRLISGRSEETNKIRKQALQYGIHLLPYRLLHIGTDNSVKILEAFYQYLRNQPNVTIHFGETTTHILFQEDRVIGVQTDKSEYYSKYVTMGVGRAGAHWLRKEAELLGLEFQSNPVDIGVRVEVPAEITSHLTDLLYEFKCHFYAPTFDQDCRTFCVVPNGEVVREIAYGENGEQWVTVNGHAYASEEHHTNNTNFAILVSSSFTEPFDDPIAFGRSVCKLANLLSNGEVIIQRLTDLKRGRRSTPSRILRSIISPTLKSAVPGDLSFVLPYRHLMSILEMIKALDNIIPGIDSNNTFLYGIETKYYSNQLRLTNELETQIKGLFAMGDGAGVTRSLAHASLSGIIVARAISSRLEKKA
ncbi:MAG: NAD(P)/FAD-dependent oxidoreductase [Candidatus Thorarchaeota archaeon]